MSIIKSLILVVIAAALSSCSLLAGSQYSYTEETDTYRVKATANVQSDSEMVDLEVYVVQDGEVVKHIKFGKQGTDNSQALQVQQSAVEGTVNLGTETVRRLYPFPLLP